MLLLAFLLFVAWMILLGIAVAAHGFAGAAFWASQSVLLLALIAWETHFVRNRRREERPDGYTPPELLFLFVFAFLLMGGVGMATGEVIFSASERSRHLRTTSWIRTIATAWEARATDVNGYNAAGAAVTIPRVPNAAPFDTYPDGKTFPYTFGPDRLEPILTPTYLRTFPRTDAWGNAWQFATDKPFPRGAGEAAEFYLIRSAGANGRFDPIVRGPNKIYDCDIVYSNGQFITW